MIGTIKIESFKSLESFCAYLCSSEFICVPTIFILTEKYESHPNQD